MKTYTTRTKFDLSFQKPCAIIGITLLALTACSKTGQYGVEGLRAPGDQAGRVNINDANNYGQTALHVAAGKGFREIVQTLIDGEANVHAIDNLNRTPLHVAVQEGNLEIAVWLIRNGANVNAPDKRGKNPLHVAAQCVNNKSPLCFIRFKG